MKLRILPVAITAVLSAALLFGGWYAYGHYGVEKPLDKVASSLPGVVSAETSNSVNKVVLTVKLSSEADLADIYHKVRTEGSGSIGSKSLELVISEPEDAQLEKAWRSALFEVAEAMEHREYSGVKDAMDELMEQVPGLEAETEMDDTNVYVSLRMGDAAKYVILPRSGQEMGVWPNA
ncbi:hypothetical protein [Cohnella fermenti]|uniref:Uncharacterized protein n=1 Tax=Cohnella fermenti TaxID=2565925 RepID=A0A4V3WF03_9BACL|nr:hypothetical protein [Cohnella fermenti]THF78418.1 hypothetical protein E6C55_14520 [Cohnella fermenti]